MLHPSASIRLRTCQVESKGAPPTQRQFTGQINESQLGLYFFNARWYDPASGRFTSADSLVPEAGNPQAWDRYAYSNNNPIKYIDPTGHYTEMNDPCLNGCPIIDLSAWPDWTRTAATIILAVTVDNLTGGRTGVIGDGEWGVVPTGEYINSGTWMVPPVFGGVVGGADDLLKISADLAEDSARGLSGQPFRSLTSRNFRENLRRLTGKRMDDIVGLESHHVFPQAFEKDFQELGIENIHDPRFGSWVDPTAHRRWSYAYNREWKTFLERKSCPEEILNFAKQLAEKYKFDVHFP